MKRWINSILFPLSQLVPKKKLRRIESISDDGHWILFSVDGYKGLNSEYLFKYKLDLSVQEK